MRAYTDLDVWKKARVLASSVYRLSRSFPKEELFGLTLQIRRAAVSIVSNIAEGCGRQTTKDAVNFFYFSRGSLFEVETQLYVAFDENYISEEQLKVALEEVMNCKKLLHGFINYYRGLPPKSQQAE
ncbi:four helix bundle protein [Rufibacter quisquiliarum]|uniref:Four helix bundle protein n=1 Tax=Rufibacter quisquiliarum TaxID=1549639 RepID=A0A839GLF2_9BACT|nr:four helix bundle protein [Rufibacter quisquiliarum]MBA9076415.1 four helix bundle protein [Rufibacter quisquiliarum]